MASAQLVKRGGEFDKEEQGIHGGELGKNREFKNKLAGIF